MLTWVYMCVCIYTCVYVSKLYNLLCMFVYLCMCTCNVKFAVCSGTATNHIAKSRTQVIHPVHTTGHKTATLQNLVQRMYHQRQHIPLSFLGNPQINKNVKHKIQPTCFKHANTIAMVLQ